MSKKNTKPTGPIWAQPFFPPPWNATKLPLKYVKEVRVDDKGVIHLNGFPVCHIGIRGNELSILSRVPDADMERVCAQYGFPLHQWDGVMRGPVRDDVDDDKAPF